MAKLPAKWTKLASTERLQRSSQTASVVADKLYVFGGELHPREPVDSQFDVIELGGGESTRLETIPAQGETPTPRVGSASTVLRDTIYLFSGRGGVAMAPIEEKGQLWAYAPSTSKWSLISPADAAAPYPAARSYHTMTNDGRNTIYVHAGCPESGRLSDLWAFDIGTQSWSNLAAAPDPPRGGTSIAFCAGKLYRMNGFDGKHEQGGSLDVYDPLQDSWSTITYSADGETGPEPRSVGALLALGLSGRDHLVTLFGEHDPSALGHAGAGKMLGSAWVYDVGAGSWTAIEAEGESPQPRGWFDADVFTGTGGRQGIVVHGGLAEDNSRLGDIWVLEIGV